MGRRGDEMKWWPGWMGRSGWDAVERMGVCVCGVGGWDGVDVGWCGVGWVGGRRAGGRGGRLLGNGSVWFPVGRQSYP